MNDDSEVVSRVVAAALDELPLGVLEVAHQTGDDVHLVRVAVQVEALAEETVQHTAHERALHPQRHGRIYDGNEVDVGPRQVLVQVVKGHLQLAAVLVGRGSLTVVALRRTYVVGTEQHRHHLPIVVKVDERVLFHLLDQEYGLLVCVGCSAHGEGHVHVCVAGQKLPLTCRVALEIRVELLEDVGQGQEVAPVPLSASAPGHAAILDERAQSELLQGAVAGHQRVAHGADDGDVARAQPVHGGGRRPGATEGNRGRIARERHGGWKERLPPNTGLVQWRTSARPGATTTGLSKRSQYIVISQRTEKLCAGGRRGNG